MTFCGSYAEIDCTCCGRVAFDHGGHVLTTLQLDDGQNLGSTGGSRTSIGTISAQSSIVSLASDVGQRSKSPVLEKNSVLTLGPLDPSVIKTQTTVVVMSGRAPLLGETAPLRPPVPSRLPPVRQTDPQARSRGSTHTASIALPPTIDQPW